MAFYNDTAIKMEQEIVELYVSGLSQTEIAEQLNIAKERVDYVIKVKDEMDSISHNGENTKSRKPMIESVVKEKSERKQKLWNSIIELHNKGLTQKDIAINIDKSQSYVAKVIRDIRNEDSTLLKDNSRNHGTRKRYTKEEKEVLTTEILEMYNGGMTVEEIANLKDKASSTVERWINEARKEGREVRLSRREKQAGTKTPSTQENKEQQEVGDDGLLDDIINSLNAFADSHLLLGKHIEKLFEILDRRDSDGR